MRILHLIHHAGKGGTERYVLAVARGLRDKGLVKAFFLYDEGGLLVERMEAAEIPCGRISLPSRYSLRAAKTVAHFCREHHIDVIHTHFLRENYIALLSRLFYPKTRVVYTNHLILPNDFITRLSNRLLSRAQAAVLAGCRPGAEQLAHNGIPARITRVIHNGVSPQQWGGAEGGALRLSLGIPEDTVVLVYSARFVDGKGHFFLLDAVKRLMQKTKRPFRLLLAGDGPHLEAVRTQAQGLPVDFLGFREDMPSVLCAADVCVNASESETICMSILEGMASGLPVVATLVGGTGEIITGEEGLTAPYGDAEAFAEAMGRMVMDETLRARCAAAARRRIEEHFNQDRMLAEIYEAYKEES